jgi:hypothetical protein
MWPVPKVTNRHGKALAAVEYRVNNHGDLIIGIAELGRHSKVI